MLMFKFSKQCNLVIFFLVDHKLICKFTFTGAGNIKKIAISVELIAFRRLVMSHVFLISFNIYG